MTTTSYSTPLIALDGVVLDLETTGLDARTARIVQVGAVRVRGGEVVAGERFERLINPGLPIPKATTAVHGIADEHVRGAPDFAEAWPELEAFIGRSILIGHSIGYDLNVLAREHERRGRNWQPPRALDIRVLARIVAPSLAEHSLEKVCDWLGVAIEGRHTAIGDARATAAAFAAMIPLLRQGNVRTLAEAEAASRRLAEQQARQSGGLMVVPGAPAPDPTAVLRRIDSFPYRHRVRDVMSAPPATVSADTTVSHALHMLIEQRISSVFITGDAGGPGIATERDMLRAIASVGEMALQQPVGLLMKRPLQGVPEDAFVYRAIGRMERLGIRHLAVTGAAGELVGAVTTRNLLRHRATTAIMLGDEIDSAADVAALARARAQLAHMAKSLLEEEVDAYTIAAVISSEVRALTARAAMLAEARMAEAGRGGPPVPYALLVLGSGGRGESLLAADQDNAIVFAEGEPGGAADKWFETLGAHIADILDEVGVPYCKGGVMAKNPQWRMSLAGWRTTIDGWIRRKQPQDLLNIDIFFDGVPVHGDAGLGDAVWHHAYERGQQSPLFVHLLGEVVRQWRAPFTLFGGLRSDNGRIDLKLYGLMPIFGGARVLSIRHGVLARATPERLNGVAAKGVGSPSDIEEVVRAHRVLLAQVLGQQLSDTEQGVPLSSKVVVDGSAAGKSRKEALRTALKSVETIVALVGEGRF